MTLDHRHQLDLVGVFDRHELALEGRIVGKLFEAAQVVEIAHPGIAAEAVRDEFRQARVGLEQPATRRDAVGLVLEFAGIEVVELGEEGALEQLGVQGGDAIDRVGADDGQVGHADHLGAAFLDE